MENTSILAGWAVLETVIVFIFQVMVARYLGPEGFGRLGWALTYAMLTAVWSDPGISIALTKLVAISHGEQQLDYVSKGLTLKIGLTSVVFALALVPCAFVPYMRENFGLILLILISDHMRNLALFFGGVFRGHQQIKYEAISMGTERVGALLLAWPLLYFGYGIRAMAWVYVIARMCSLAVALISNTRAFGWRPLGFDRSLLSRIVTETAPLAVLIICERTNMYLPPLLVNAFSDERALGIFNAAFKAVYPAVLMCTAVAGSLYAPMAARFHANPAESARLYRAGLRGLMHLLLPVAVITLFLSPQVTIVLYGPEYSESARVLQILTAYYVSIIFIALNHLFMPAINRQRVVGVVSLISVAVNAGLAVLFISRWGAEGAGLSLAAAQVVIACVYVAMARRFGKAGLAPREWFTMAAAFLLAAGALYLARPYLPGPGISSLLERLFAGRHLLLVRSLVEVVEGVVLSVIVYLSFLFGRGGVSDEERRMFAAVSRRLSLRSAQEA